MENKGGFHEHLCPRVSASSFRPFKQARLFSGLSLLFYRRAGTRVWKKCSLQTTSVTTTVLEVGQQAGRVFSYLQAKKRKKSVDKSVSVIVCARNPSPAQDDYLATALAESLCWHTHWNPQKQIASQGFPQSLLSDWNLECIAVAADSVLTIIKPLVQCWMRKN